MIVGDDTDYQGEIEVKRNTIVIASRQEHHGLDEVSVLEYIQADLPEFARLAHIIDTYPLHMGDNVAKITRYSEALERFSQLGYYQVEDEITRLFEAYQIDPAKLHGLMTDLSGGQKRMVELIKVQRSRGDLALIEGDPQLAIDRYRRVVVRDFHLLAVVLPKLADATRRAGDEQAFDAVIDELIRQGAGSKAEIAYAAIVSGYYDDPLILECVREMLASDSDLRDIAAAFVPEGTADLPVERVRAVAGALRNVVQRHARYRCRVCGIDSSQFLWHCPGCHSWDTLRAIAALEFLPRAARPRSPGA
jgi:hypothetical protein